MNLRMDAREEAYIKRKATLVMRKIIVVGMDSVLHVLRYVEGLASPDRATST